MNNDQRIKLAQDMTSAAMDIYEKTLGMRDGETTDNVYAAIYDQLTEEGE